MAAWSTGLTSNLRIASRIGSNPVGGRTLNGSVLVGSKIGFECVKVNSENCFKLKSDYFWIEIGAIIDK